MASYIIYIIFFYKATCYARNNDTCDLADQFGDHGMCVFDNNNNNNNAIREEFVHHIRKIEKIFKVIITRRHLSLHERQGS